MKILQIGCGGIGSFLTEELQGLVWGYQLPEETEITIADNDIVEINQIKYQNFSLNDIGKYKVEAVAECCNYRDMGNTEKKIVKPKVERIT